MLRSSMCTKAKPADVCCMYRYRVDVCIDVLHVGVCVAVVYRDRVLDVWGALLPQAAVTTTSQLITLLLPKPDVDFAEFYNKTINADGTITDGVTGQLVRRFGPDKGAVFPRAVVFVGVTVSPLSSRDTSIDVSLVYRFCCSVCSCCTYTLGRESGNDARFR